MPFSSPSLLLRRRPRRGGDLRTQKFQFLPHRLLFRIGKLVDHRPRNVAYAVPLNQSRNSRGSRVPLRQLGFEKLHPDPHLFDLRGFVDLYDGARHLYQCLIVASEEDGGQMRYEFKRSTEARDAAPLDFARDEDAPVALIPQF